MTYRTSDALLGIGAVPVHVLQSWFEERGRKAASRFGKNGQYTPVPSDLAQTLVEECERYDPVVVNYEIAAAQIDEETAGWQSEYARERLNPGGIGAEDDNPDEAYTFPSLRAGLAAHIAHMLTYAAGIGAWNQIDPRFRYTPKANIGKRTTIGSLAGAWATQPRYGEFIVERANNLLAFAADYDRENPMAGDMPGVPFVAADGRHHTTGRTVAWPDLLIQHHTDGYDSLAWLTTSPNSDVSATYLMHRNGTPRAQLVRHADTPHTTGGVLNPRSITSEWERKWPEQKDVPDETYRNLGAFWADVVRIERGRGNPHFQGTPSRKQLTSHKEQYPSYTCPGNLDIDRIYRELLSALGDDTPPVSDEPPAEWYLHLGGGKMAAYPFELGFRAHVYSIAKAHYPGDPNSAALALFGEPKEREWKGADGHSYQKCKRLTLHWIPGNLAPWSVVHEPAGARLSDKAKDE